MNYKEKRKNALESIIIGSSYFLLFTPFILFHFKPCFSIIILSLLELGSIYLIFKGLKLYKN